MRITNTRKKQNAEIYTPCSLVDEMLDRLPASTWIAGKLFCDPACGDGAFLVEVLKRKLSMGHPPLEALQSVYGADIMQDSVEICRYRLLEVYLSAGNIDSLAARRAVAANIVWVDPVLYPRGTLDFGAEWGSRQQEISIHRFGHAI